MLVISQKEGEELSIGDEVVVRVLSIKKGRVKLGISAPEQLKVTRRQDQTAIKPEPKSLQE